MLEDQMKKWVCNICGHVYDEAAGDPERGIAPGMPFADLPDSWMCPDCGAKKDAFELLED
jgi:rubredoxin